MKNKKCKTCELELPLSEYPSNPRYLSCKKCVNIRQKELRLAKIEERRADARELYYKNREKCLAKVKERSATKKQEKSEYDKLYRIFNKLKIAEYKKQWATENAEQIAERMKNYRKENAEKIATEKSQYLKNNRPKINATKSIYEKNRRATDSLFKLKKNTRKMVSRYMLNGKCKRTQEIIGCTYEELKLHIEKQFIEGMTWDNYGADGWHIDHIKPLAVANSEEEIISLNHYTNLQPLWALDNLKKGATFEEINYKTKQ